jgi:hypothetical protein
MEAPVLKIATFITALVAAGALASQAEAHDFDGFHGFHPSPFFRNQDRPFLRENHCEEERRRHMEEAFARSRAGRFEAMQSQRAAAAAASANSRARVVGLGQKKALRAAVAKHVPSGRQTSAPAVATATKKSDLQQASTDIVKPTQTTTVASAEVCRKYSAAADGLIDVPCQQ